MPTALITGASKGIGREAARLFAQSGWDLLLISRDAVALKALTADLNNFGIKVFYQAIDLSEPNQIFSKIHFLMQKGLCPSVLINNAGVAWTGDLLKMPLERWQWLFQMNLTSVYQVCTAVVPYMRKEGGLVINVSSHAARNAFPQWGAYCISKAAVDSFTKCLAIEERQNSIRACTLTLGAVNTSLWDSETVQSDFDRSSMLSVEEAAQAIYYLANQPSSQIVEDITLMPAKGAF